MSVGQILKNKYRLDEEIGHGGFGMVFRATHLVTSKQYALKIDAKRKGVALSEAKILSDLVDGVGIPKLHSKGSCLDFTYFVMELLDSSLQRIIKQCGGSLNIETVAKAGTQIVNRLEFIHNRGYIHRDIKPSQFLMGRKQKILYLVDYGLAKKYQIFKNHVPFQTHCPRAGNATYASVNSHMGIRQSRRDDLESAGYMIVYMYKGSLPWQSRHNSNSVMKWQKVFLKKASISLAELCHGCPEEILKFMEYSRSLKFEEKPDYAYIKNLLNSLLNKYEETNKLKYVKSRTSQENDSSTPNNRTATKYARSRSNFLRGNLIKRKRGTTTELVSEEGIIQFPNKPKSYIDIKMHNEASSLPDPPSIYIYPGDQQAPLHINETCESSPRLNFKFRASVSGYEEKMDSSFVSKPFTKDSSSPSAISVDFSKDTEDSTNTCAKKIRVALNIQANESNRIPNPSFSYEAAKVARVCVLDRSLQLEDDDTPKHNALPEFKDRNILSKVKKCAAYS